VKSGDHVLRYRPLRALAVACAYHARRSGNAVSKQRLAFVSEQYLLWCPLRCEIPLFKYTTWYSFNTNNDVLDLLGVMAHYLDEHNVLRAVVLGLRDTHGSHTGANIGDHLFDVLGDYKLRSKISFFAADNATNNDTALKLLSNRLVLNPVKQQLRCAGHVLHLVCKAILYGVDEDCVIDTLSSLDSGNHSFTAVSAFEDTLHAANEQAKLTVWRKKGAISKLHNLIVHIKANNKRMELFEAKQREALPHCHAVYRAVLNGGIRWNSAYEMINRAIKLKDSLMLYQEHHHSDEALEALAYDDWTELTHLHTLLEPIHECSLNVQSASLDGGHGALHEVLTTMDYLLDHLEETKQRLSDPKIVTHFKASVNLGWKKLDYYYNLTDQTAAYVLAVFLHPHYKFRWFEIKWSSRITWIEQAKGVINTAYNAAKKDHSDDIPTRSPPRELSRFEAFTNLDSNTDDDDDLQLYWHEKRAPHTVEQLQWWRDNHHRFPILRHLAFTLLAAPASTAATERLFSCAGNVVNKERPHTQQELAQSMQCLRSWYSQGII
jgi:hypothetical protein